MSLLAKVKKILLESDYTKTPEFKKWFGKSVLKNSDGSPMHFYHGTDKDFDSFSNDFIGNGNDSYGSGFYFTNRPDIASNYSSNKDNSENSHPNVMKVHLRAENPIDKDDDRPLQRSHIQKIITSAPNHRESLENHGDISYEGYNKVLKNAVDAYANIPKYNAMGALHNDFYGSNVGAFLNNFKKITGHDSVIVNHDNHSIVNIFHPSQIKSAIGNNGKFSSDSNNITESIDLYHGTNNDFTDFFS